MDVLCRNPWLAPLWQRNASAHSMSGQVFPGLSSYTGLHMPRTDKRSILVQKLVSGGRGSLLSWTTDWDDASLAVS